MYCGAISYHVLAGGREPQGNRFLIHKTSVQPISLADHIRQTTVAVSLQSFQSHGAQKIPSTSFKRRGKRSCAKAHWKRRRRPS